MRSVALGGEDNTVHERVIKGRQELFLLFLFFRIGTVVNMLSFLQPQLELFETYCFEDSDVPRVKTGISSNHDLSLNADGFALTVVLFVYLQENF